MRDYGAHPISVAKHVPKLNRGMKHWRMGVYKHCSSGGMGARVSWPEPCFRVWTVGLGLATGLAAGWVFVFPVRTFFDIQGISGQCVTPRRDPFPERVNRVASAVRVAYLTGSPCYNLLKK